MSNKQKWARYGLIAFATMLLVIGTVVLGGMNNVNAAKHTHSYRWVVKKAATCTSEGYRNYECACGSCINSATIAKTPHTWDRGAATCTLPKKCRVCGTIGHGPQLEPQRGFLHGRQEVQILRRHRAARHGTLVPVGVHEGRNLHDGRNEGESLHEVQLYLRDAVDPALRSSLGYPVRDLYAGPEVHLLRLCESARYGA